MFVFNLHQDFNIFVKSKMERESSNNVKKQEIFSKYNRFVNNILNLF